MQKRRAIIRAYHEFFSRYRWSWWCVLKFHGWPCRATAERRLNEWLADLRTHNGTRHFRWLRVTEMGKSGVNLHFHLLIGGIRSLDFGPYETTWNHRGGVATIRHYRPADFNAEGNGLRYILKTFSLDKGIDIDSSLFTGRKSKSKRPQPSGGGMDVARSANLTHEHFKVHDRGNR